MDSVYDAEPEERAFLYPEPLEHTYLVGDWWNGAPTLGTMRTFNDLSAAIHYAQSLRRRDWIRIYQTSANEKPVRIKF